MTARGRADQLITIQRGTPSTDGYGEETLTWSTYATEWAQVFYGKGDERRAAGLERGAQAATFRVLSNASTRAVTLKDRISHDGSVYDIVGIAPDVPQRGELEFTAVRAL